MHNDLTQTQTMIVAHERSDFYGDLRDKVVAFVFLGQILLSGTNS